MKEEDAMEVDEVMNESSNDEELYDALKMKYDDLEDKLSEMTSASAPAVCAEFQEILSSERSDEAATKIKEKSIYRLARIYSEQGMFDDVMTLLKNNNAFFTQIPKAKTAKIVRSIIDIVSKTPDSLDIQLSLCENVIEWCVAEKRTFLRHRIESKLASLYLEKKLGSKAMATVNSLLRELKRLDDKQMLTEVHLLESRVHHILENVPKAKAALTAARTAANSIYVTPLLQAELDQMCGVLQCEERDTVTAFSYFLEAFEAFDSCKDRRAMDCLKYMCLSKILGDHAAEVSSILASKNGLKYIDSSGLRAMAAVAAAAKKKSLEDFEAAVEEHAVELKSDELISHHLEILYDQMLEGNLLKIIHPFSCVEISHVAKLIKMPVATVERKLSQMILDRTFSGILEEGKGHLVVYESAPEDKSFSYGGEIISNMENVVAALFERAKNLTTKTETITSTEEDNKKNDSKGAGKEAEEKKD